MLGMHIPGEGCVIVDSKIRFPQPLYVPEDVVVRGELVHYSASANAGVVSVHIQDLKRTMSFLESEVTFTTTGAPQQGQLTGEVRSMTTERISGRRTLLVTGGTGGVGAPLVRQLSRKYNLVCTSRFPGEDSSDNAVRRLVVDLENENALEVVLDELDPRDFYAVLHMSGARPQSTLLSDDLVGVQRQIHHAVTVPILLTKWLRRPTSSVRRLILLGSTAGTEQPRATMGAYSLAKSCSDALPKLLALDTAAQECTVNTIALGATGVGINEGMTNLEKARIVSERVQGRLMNESDISGVIDFLLSDSSLGINGTVITVDGGTVYS